jgi:hypothetical protein
MRENCEKCGERLTGYFIHNRPTPTDSKQAQIGNYYYHCSKCGNQGVEKFKVRGKTKQESELEKERLDQLFSEEPKEQNEKY